MTERERLLAILKIPIYPHECVDPLEAVADFLLDYGVKVPVLCRECKNWRKPWLAGQELGKCMLGRTALTKPDHYCAYGGMRASGEESND